MGRVIAIDGPSGAGKSTVARMLADRLGFVYLDTGALYRAVALFFLRKGIVPEDNDRVLSETLESAEVGFRDGRVFLNGADVSRDIRTPEVGHYSSVFSARNVVREFLLGVQRNAALDNDVVAEGRDTTTVIFPGAQKKFFMDATVAERTRRRYRQLKEMGMEVTEEKAQRDVVERDARDRGRDIAPLTRAKDAIIIDTTDRSIEQIVGNILEIVKSDP